MNYCSFWEEALVAVQVQVVDADVVPEVVVDVDAVQQARDADVDVVPV